jgi:hypothetical protein
MSFSKLKNFLIIKKSLHKNKQERSKFEKKFKNETYSPCEIFSFSSIQKDKYTGIDYECKDYFIILSNIDKNLYKTKTLEFVKLTGLNAGETFQATIEPARSPQNQSHTFYENIRKLTLKCGSNIYVSHIDLENGSQPLFNGASRSWRCRDFISQKELSELSINFNNNSLKREIEHELNN